MLFLTIIFLLGLVVFFWPIFVVLGSILMLPETWAVILAVLIAGWLLFFIENKLDKK